MTFDDAVEIIFKVEGASADKKDPGGKTKYGISQKAFPYIDIQTLTKDKAKQIYRAHYWEALKLDTFPPNLRLPLFDSAVNQGKDATIRMLQTCLNIYVDGIIGNQTCTALATADHNFIEVSFMAARALRYTGTKQFDKYGKGWLRRLFRLYTLSRDFNNG